MEKVRRSSKKGTLFKEFSTKVSPTERELIYGKTKTNFVDNSTKDSGLEGETFRRLALSILKGII